MTENVLVEALSVFPSASQPRRDGGLTGAEDAFGGGNIQPFSQRSEHHGDVVRWGFQTVERGVASGSECRVTRRTSEGLDPLGAAMFAVSEKPHGCEQR